MQNELRIVYLLVLVSVLVSCGKEASKVNAEEKKKGRIYFKGITERDDQGNILKLDTNDWKFGRKFTPLEDSLFETYDTLSMRSDTIKVYCAANPTRGNSIDIYHYNMKPGTEMYWMLVDSNYKILRKDYNSYMIHVYGLGLSLKSDEYNHGDTLRYYYKMKYKNECYKGYGDIVVIK